MGKKRKIIILAVAFALTAPAVTVYRGVHMPEQYEEVQAAAPAPVKNTEKDRQIVLSMGQEPGTVIVSWKGDEDGPGSLRCAEDKADLPVSVPIKAQKEKILKGNYYRYNVKLSGLEEGEQYYYEIGDGLVFDSPGFFYAPDDSGKTVFAYFGDPQFDVSLDDYDAWGKQVWQMYGNHSNVEFVIAGGDMVNSPTSEGQWNGFLRNCGLFAMVPLMSVPGNHEGVTSNATYRKLFQHIENGPTDSAFYYFDYGNCRFVMMDSSFMTKERQKAMGKEKWCEQEKELEKWLCRVLSQSSKPWNIVVTHHPVYGMHDAFTPSPKIRKYWLPIMKEEGVDLVLCGHQHAYMRTEKIDGITYVMGNSGGKSSEFYKGFNGPGYSQSVYAAAPNYQIITATKTKLELTSYDSSNVVIDSFRLPYFRIF